MYVYALWLILCFIRRVPDPPAAPPQLWGTDYLYRVTLALYLTEVGG